MMPSDSYRLYQTERMKSATEIRRADEQAGQLMAAVARLVRAITRAGRPARPAPGSARAVVPHAAAPAGRRAG